MSHGKKLEFIFHSHLSSVHPRCESRLNVHFDGGENQLLAENLVELLVKNISFRGVFRNFL